MHLGKFVFGALREGAFGESPVGSPAGVFKVEGNVTNEEGSELDRAVDQSAGVVVPALVGVPAQGDDEIAGDYAVPAVGIDVGEHQFINYGIVRPGGGQDPGAFSLIGDFVQGATGVLEVDLNGLAAVVEYDQSVVYGSAQLGGTLEIHTLPDYTDPQLAGETHEFVLLAATDRQGEFATVDFNGEPLPFHAGGGLFRDVVYDPWGVSLRHYRALIGDANGDRVVSASGDGAILLANLGGGAGKTWTDADFTGAGLVTASGDGAALLASLGATADAAQATPPVPEPASLLLLLLAGGPAVTGVRIRRRTAVPV